MNNESKTDYEREQFLAKGFPSAIHEAASRLNSHVWKLEGIIATLAYMGAVHPAKDLGRIAADLILIGEVITKVVSQEIGDQVKRSEESSSAMLRACIAGHMMAPRTTREQKEALAKIVNQGDQ